MPIALLVLAVAAAPAKAQPWDLFVRLDNDGFVGFAPTDYEYTHGSVVTLRKWDPCQPSCSEQSAWSVSVSHLIFTAREVDVVGERRPAGWLRAVLSRDVVDPGSGSTTFGVIAGLVGPEAGGEPIQRAAHRIFGFRQPTGWDLQLPTRVEVGGWWNQRWQFAEGPGWLGAAVESTVSASTIRDYARVSIAGFATRRSLANLRLSATVGGRAVFYDYLLTGVDPVRLLAEGSVGVQVHVLGIDVRYELMARTRAYEEEPEGFMNAGIRLGLRW